MVTVMRCPIGGPRDTHSGQSKCAGQSAGDVIGSREDPVFLIDTHTVA